MFYHINIYYNNNSNNTFYSLCLPGTAVRRSGSSGLITNGRGSGNIIGQSGARLSVPNRNQLEPSPQELPVKDTDRAIDVASAECKYYTSLHYKQFCQYLYS